MERRSKKVMGPCPWLFPHGAWNFGMIIAGRTLPLRVGRAVLLMSALGQKQTFAAQKVMSALAPKADMCSAQADVR